MLAKGKQFHIGLKKSEHYQGFTAPGGVDTTLFTMTKQPLTLDSLKVFVGSGPAGNERLVFRGVHYEVTTTQIEYLITLWKIVWKSSAPFALTPTMTVSAVYFTKE